MIWSPYEQKYSLMLERIQNKFLRYIYLRLYGVYPFYPLSYPSLFVLGMVGYDRVAVRRELSVARYVFGVLRGRTSDAAVLGEVSLSVPDQYVWRRRRPPLLHVPCCRTNLLKYSPFVRALRTLNEVAQRVDLFHCTLSEFTLNCLFVICYGKKSDYIQK
ncbi:uncharacterized protein LOC121736202 [Aricia agestis]|uniref:uncharacterized protein LOC121736202 n=1 Tax=Aricia agestis TaxID=91739 RepID=UPI001C203857|nr:uncharacterized protein LOC121736202 [Aricia agestis]